MPHRLDLGGEHSVELCRAALTPSGALVDQRLRLADRRLVDLVGDNSPYRPQRRALVSHTVLAALILRNTRF